MGRRPDRVEFRVPATAAVVTHRERELRVVRLRQAEEPLAGLRAELLRANINREPLKTAER
jgi:hypothetical protein